jgi:biotin carboxylase
VPGLEINSYQLEQIIDKNKFRFLLNELCMISPDTIIIKSKEELQKWLNTQYEQGLSYILKPNDSSGSKGVSLVNRQLEFEKSFNLAMRHSLSGRVIIEKYLYPNDFQICGDGIVKNGRLVFFGKGRGVCYSQSFIPLAEAFPYPTDKYDDAIKVGIEKICNKLRIKNCIFNVDIIPTDNGLFFCEFTPRLAGNFLYVAIRYCWGVDLFKAQVDPLYQVSPRLPTPSISGMLHQSSNIKISYSLDIYSEYMKQLVTCNKTDQKKYEEYFKNSQTYGNCILSSSDNLIFNDMISKSPAIFRLEQ